MIRVGLIGAGYMMQVTHLMSLRAIDGIERVAIADWDTALAERVARANGIPRVYPSAGSLVEGEPNLDAVVVVTRKEHHLDAALPALERGIATLIEKPLASNIEGGRQLVETAERTGAILMVGYMKRYDPWGSVGRADHDLRKYRASRDRLPGSPSVSQSDRPGGADKRWRTTTAARRSRGLHRGDDPLSAVRAGRATTPDVWPGCPEGSCVLRANRRRRAHRMSRQVGRAQN